MKVLKYMFLSAKLIPLINTITNERFMAQWAFIENDAKRESLLGNQTQPAHDLLRTSLPQTCSVSRYLILLPFI